MSTSVGSALLLFAVLAVLVLSLRRLEKRCPRRRIRWLHLACPRGRGPVECAFGWDPGRRAFVSVESCSGLARPREITCPQTCLAQLNDPFGLDREGSGDRVHQ